MSMTTDTKSATTNIVRVTRGGPRSWSQSTSVKCVERKKCHWFDRHDTRLWKKQHFRTISNIVWTPLRCLWLVVIISNVLLLTDFKLFHLTHGNKNLAEKWEKTTKKYGRREYDVCVSRSGRKKKVREETGHSSWQVHAHFSAVGRHAFEPWEFQSFSRNGIFPILISHFFPYISFARWTQDASANERTEYSSVWKSNARKGCSQQLKLSFLFECIAPTDSSPFDSIGKNYIHDGLLKFTPAAAYNGGYVLRTSRAYRHASICVSICKHTSDVPLGKNRVNGYLVNWAFTRFLPDSILGRGFQFL